MKSIFICLFVAFIALSSYAQTSSGVSSDGRDFYVGMVLPSYDRDSVAKPITRAFFGAYMLISSYADNTVNISYFNRKLGKEMLPTSYHIPARTAIQVLLDSASTSMQNQGDTAEYAACHVTANSPINIQYFSTGACSGGSYLSLATPALGRKYVIASYGDNNGDLGIIVGGDTSYTPDHFEDSHGLFLIIAPFDNTTVTITPNSTTMGGFIGYHSGAGSSLVKHPYTVTLSRGQCYLVKSKGDQGDDDISGSIVESDKPIAVLGGHENAALGGVTNRNLEGRDFMIEQMIPTEFWDSTGYVSIPLKDSQPADASAYDGVGEDYRTYSDSQACINLTMPSVSGQIGMNTGELDQPPPERFGVTEPVCFDGCNGKKFSVMMYDLRNFANFAPFPAPSMMTIIPVSHWKTSYMWYVPINKFEILQAYYVDVICQTADLNAVQNGILASFNGGSIKPIKTVVSQEQQWKGSIPCHPELTGVRFKLSPGSYYATGPHPFIVYNFGFRALDPNMDLGDFDYDDYFFSYANPTGASLSSGDPANFKVSIDSSCTKWSICVTDQRKNNPGIRSISLLNDSLGIEFSPGLQSVNVRFDTALDPNNFGEVELPGTQNSVCFSVIAVKPLSRAYAAVLITDNAGNERVIEMENAGPKLATNPSVFPIDFGIHGIGSDSCIQVSFVNVDALGATRLISEAKLSEGGLFSVSSTNPPLPTTLKVNDTLTVNICFTGTDSGTVRDTLRLGLECFDDFFPVKAQGTAPVIFASDVNFGIVDTGLTVCKSDTIRNIGTTPLILEKNFLVTNSLHFSVADSARLPLTIQPGKFEVLSICYTPNGAKADTGQVHWTTNEGNQNDKDNSLLTGTGDIPGILWNVNSYTYFADSTQSTIARVYLVNHSLHDAVVQGVQTQGVDYLHFTIAGDQLGYIPLSNFPLKKGAEIWVDIRFSPELTGPPPGRYADKHAQCIATATGEKSAVLDLTATYAQNSVKQSAQNNPLSIRPNPANGNSIILSFDAIEGENAEVKIFDVLGREMYAKNIFGEKSLQIPIRNLQNGMYYAKVVIGDKTLTGKFEIRR